MPSSQAEVTFLVSIKRVCNEHQFDEEELREQLKILQRERIFSLQMLERIDPKALLKVLLRIITN